jgi:hypothetical protein
MKKLLMLWCVMAVALFAAHSIVDMPPDAEISHGPSLPYNGYRQSPGYETGLTDYDFQNNGSIGRYVVITPSGGFHFYYTYQYDGVGDNRRATYDYHYPPSYWLTPTAMDADITRMGSLSQLGDGRAVGSAHMSPPAYSSRVYVDAVEGAGTFTVYDLPGSGAPTCPIWPKMFADTVSGNIYVAGTENGGVYSFWTMSTDDGMTWAPWDSVLGSVALVQATNYLQAGREAWGSSHNTGWTMLANSNGTRDMVVTWETQDGIIWYEDTIWAQTATDSCEAWFWKDVCYDNNAYAHVVFDLFDTTSVHGGTGTTQGSGWRSQIWHWDQTADVLSQVDGGMGWYWSNPYVNHGTVSEPRLTIDRATGDLYCTWTHADSLDVALNGYNNMDIWGARSTDNGHTWIEHHNITNSPSPGADTGFCDSDCWQSLADETLGDTLVLFYMNDKQAGSAVFQDATGFTDNPMLFYLYAWNPPGVEEHKTEAPMRLALNIAPNPSVRNTQISYTLSKAGTVSLNVYSVDGRLVETVYNGDRDAGVYTENLNAGQFANGTYFVVFEAANAQITKSLVVVR